MGVLSSGINIAQQLAGSGVLGSRTVGTGLIPSAPVQTAPPLGVFGRMNAFMDSVPNPNAFDILTKALPQGAQDNQLLQFLVKALKSTKVRAGGGFFSGGGEGQGEDEDLRKLLAKLLGGGATESPGSSAQVPVTTIGGSRGGGPIGGIGGSTDIGGGRQGQAVDSSPIEGLFRRRLA